MRVFVILMLLAFFSIPAGAETSQDGKGYIYVGTPGAEPLTLVQIPLLPDQTYVTLNGNLIAKGENSFYLFRDGSGQIPVKISEDLFSGRSVNAQDPVIITGVMDMKDGKNIFIDVKELEIPNR